MFFQRAVKNISRYCSEFPSVGNNSGFCLQREMSQINQQSLAPRAGCFSPGIGGPKKVCG